MPLPAFIAPIVSGLLATNVAQRSIGLFKTFSNHPLGFGILYAGGTTIGYHSNPLNWRQNYKYVGKPQYVIRL
jgi:hypothetical protein